MQIKTVAVMAMAACAIGFSTGCVKQEDLDALEATKNKEIETLKADHEVALAEKDEMINDLNVEIMEVKDLATTSEAKAEEAELKVEDLAAELESTKDRLASAEDDRDDLEADVEELEAEISEANAARREALAEAENIREEFDEFRLALVELQKVKPSDFAMELSVSELDKTPAQVMKEAGVLQAGEADVDNGVAGENLQELLQNMENM